MSLQGTTVLSTRPREQSSDLIRAIEERGGCALVVPMIRIVAPTAWDECDQAIDRLAGYDGAVFTSPNAVLWFFRRLDERKVGRETLHRWAVFAVGPSTRLALEHQGIAGVGIPSEARGEALADMLRGGGCTGKRFLVPRGDLARDHVLRALEASGAIVHSPVVYCTLPPEPDDTRRLRELTARGSYGVVVFASPSAVQNYAAAVPPSLLRRLEPRPKVVAAGGTTADSIRQLGFPVDGVAAGPGASALLEAIEQVVKDS